MLKIKLSTTYLYTSRLSYKTVFDTENKTFLFTVKLKYLPTRLNATYGFLYIIISYILQNLSNATFYRKIKQNWCANWRKINNLPMKHQTYYRTKRSKQSRCCKDWVAFGNQYLMQYMYWSSKCNFFLIQNLSIYKHLLKNIVLLYIQTYWNFFFRSDGCDLILHMQASACLNEQ